MYKELQDCLYFTLYITRLLRNQHKATGLFQLEFGAGCGRLTCLLCRLLCRPTSPRSFAGSACRSQIVQERSSRNIHATSMVAYATIIYTIHPCAASCAACNHIPQCQPLQAGKELHCKSTTFSVHRNSVNCDCSRSWLGSTAAFLEQRQVTPQCGCNRLARYEIDEFTQKMSTLLWLSDRQPRLMTLKHC